MKRTHRYVQPSGSVAVSLPDGQSLEIPVVQGIFKHASADALFDLLKDPEVAAKYTREALRIAPWQVLRHFPREWLKTCLSQAHLPEGRTRALEYLLS